MRHPRSTRLQPATGTAAFLLLLAAPGGAAPRSVEVEATDVDLSTVGTLLKRLDNPDRYLPCESTVLAEPFGQVAGPTVIDAEVFERIATVERGLQANGHAGVWSAREGCALYGMGPSCCEIAWRQMHGFGLEQNLAAAITLATASCFMASRFRFQPLPV